MPSVSVQGIELCYTQQGAGEVVLLLHGLGSCKEDWHAQIAALSTQYQVIAVDLRGHGKSAKPRTGYSIRQFTEGICSFMDALQIPQWHLVGFSLGGMIAQQFAVTYPERLHSVVVINAIPSVVLDNWATRKMFWGRLLTIQLLGVQRMAQAIAQANFPRPEQSLMREQLAAQFAKNDKAAYFRSTRAIMHWDVRPELMRITCPLLAISSDKDYTPVSAKQSQLVEAVPDGHLVVIQNARHLLPMEQPVALNQALLTWLSSC